MRLSHGALADEVGQLEALQVEPGLDHAADEGLLGGQGCFGKSAWYAPVLFLIVGRGQLEGPEHVQEVGVLHGDDGLLLQRQDRHVLRILVILLFSVFNFIFETRL